MCASRKNRKDALNKVADKLTASLEEALRMKELDRLRGVEGEAATLSFGAMNQLIPSSEKEFRYTERSRRPPLDPINAMLSFAYTLLMHDARSACEAAGLTISLSFADLRW